MKVLNTVSTFTYFYIFWPFSINQVLRLQWRLRRKRNYVRQKIRWPFEPTSSRSSVDANDCHDRIHKHPRWHKWSNGSQWQWFDHWYGRHVGHRNSVFWLQWYNCNLCGLKMMKVLCIPFLSKSMAEIDIFYIKRICRSDDCNKRERILNIHLFLALLFIENTFFDSWNLFECSKLFKSLRDFEIWQHMHTYSSFSMK